MHPILGKPRQWRVGTHAARIWAFVIVTHALMILCGKQRHHRFPIYQAEQRHLRTIQERFQQHRITGSVNSINMGASGIAIRRDHHALTSGETIILDHPGRAKTIEGGLNVVIGGTGGKRLGVGCFHTGGCHHILGKRLRPLNAGGILVRSKDLEALFTQRVGHARYKGNLRADHNQVYI